MGRKPADVTRGGSSGKIFLAFSRRPDRGRPITDVAVIHRVINTEVVPSGFKVVSRASGTGGAAPADGGGGGAAAGGGGGGAAAGGGGGGGGDALAVDNLNAGRDGYAPRDTHMHVPYGRPTRRLHFPYACAIRVCTSRMRARYAYAFPVCVRVTAAAGTS